MVEDTEIAFPIGVKVVISAGFEAKPIWIVELPGEVATKPVEKLKFCHL